MDDDRGIADHKMHHLPTRSLSAESVTSGFATTAARVAGYQLAEGVCPIYLDEEGFSSVEQPSPFALGETEIP